MTWQSQSGSHVGPVNLVFMPKHGTQDSSAYDSEWEIKLVHKLFSEYSLIFFKFFLFVEAVCGVETHFQIAAFTTSFS